MKKKQNGFTLVEVIIAIALFSSVVLGTLGTLVLSSQTVANMEESINYRSQYSRAVSFVTNTIKRNEKTGAIRIEEGGRRLVINLIKDPDNYLHYYIDQKELLMYVGPESATLPAMGAEGKKQKTMRLAKDVENILFEMQADPSGTQMLKITYSVDENKDGIQEQYVDNINIYTTNN